MNQEYDGGEKTNDWVFGRFVQNERGMYHMIRMASPAHFPAPD